MEAVRKRSESPFSRSKSKNHMESSENGDAVIEQVKRKKKSRSKSKTLLNGKDTGDAINNGNDNDNYEEEKPTNNETENNVDSSNGDRENGIINGETVQNANGQEVGPEMEENVETVTLVSACDSSEEKVANETNGQTTEMEVVEDVKNTEAVDIEDIPTDQQHTEIESGAKRDSLIPCDSVAESEVVCGSSEGCNGGANDAAIGETSLNQEQESTAEWSEVKEYTQFSVNGSDGSSHYEEAQVPDHIQASPDTATKEDNSFSNKITNFLGRWSHSLEQKQDSDVSSSKKTEENTLSHPYLSKVSGRRGIKERLNSSATVVSSKEMESKTPENSGKISLDDSFRVRTNPPRLQTSDLTENPTLRKFKGKRCLNAGDDPEEEDDAYGSTIKRRKLEKNQESGLLGGILWSPFKKKSFDNEDQMKLATTESKLSRLLSPFWFWKKTAASQKGK